MLTHERPQLKALYYPYPLCTSERALKRLLLLFDTVAFINPQSAGFAFANVGQFQGPLMFPTQSQSQVLSTALLQYKWNFVESRNFDKWLDIFIQLEQLRMVIAIDPKPIVDGNDDLIANATMVDSLNTDFELTTANALKLEFVDSRYFEHIWPNESYRLNSYNWSTPQGTVDGIFAWRLDLRGVPLTLRKNWLLETPSPFSVKEETKAIDFENEGFYYLRPKYAAALALNRALVTSIYLGVPLVTDNSYFQLAISQKVTSILNFITEKDKRKKSKDVSQIVSYIYDSELASKRFKRAESERLISIALQNIISDEAIQKISLEELIDYRQKSVSERERMLASVYQWAYEVEEMIGTGKSDVLDISEKIYKTKVLPEVTKYREALGKLDKRLVPTILGSISQDLGISLTATTISSLLAGLSLEKALIVCTAIAAPLIGRSIKQILDYRVDRKEKQAESPLAYLLSVK